MVSWRNEALGRVSVSDTASLEAAVPRKQSAMTAFREFFSLSPLWLKGAVAFAVIAFCVFGSLALVGLLNRNNQFTASNKQTYTQEELNKKVDEAVQAKVKELASRDKESRSDQPIIVNDGSGSVSTAAGINRRSIWPQSAKKLTRPLTRSEREQLAVDLRLISPRDDIKLDLIGDRINQEE